MKNLERQVVEILERIETLEDVSSFELIIDKKGNLYYDIFDYYEDIFDFCSEGYSYVGRFYKGTDKNEIIQDVKEAMREHAYAVFGS